ncbi:FAD-dependent oxidoreductase [Streptomyces mangrovisoli]|uniref:Hydroxyglutarate oxidase n=1 Tax=Streptomyces mangrovisoli TaxID=1428628 RepID=A0A1J4NQE5_9ACTN|nr:FAD-dependent oxidoreductase [Streptomyces mangrovisoli]OIJ63820.1 hydroxyglutarate oxidase [Streptomyces mangrovisoli]
MREGGADCDVLVIGAGVVGLATAYAITRSAPGVRVTVLDKEDRPIRRAARVGGVVDSGIHHRPGSLMARCAVRGAAETAAFCAEQGIAHEVTGELIVATRRAELPRLHALVQRGRANGVPVRELGAVQIAEHEPEVRGLAAIHVATTAVCDLAALTGRLAEASGAELRHGARVVRVDRRPGQGVTVRTAAGAEVRAAVLVNCAGTRGDHVARLTGDEPGVRIVPYRGEYRTAERGGRVRGVVSAVPDPEVPFPGVQLARGVDGGVWAAAYTAAVGEPRRAPSPRAFADAVRGLLPSLDEDDLAPAGWGARTRAVLRDGTPADDLLIRQGARAVHVLNTPSPATGAALPIGREAARHALALLDPIRPTNPATT